MVYQSCKLILLLGLCTCAFIPRAFADGDAGKDRVRPYEFRQQPLPPGFFLRHKDRTSHVTSTQPLVAYDEISTDKLREIFENYPELKTYRVVVVVPEYYADKRKLKDIKVEMRRQGAPADIQLVRNPKRIWEKILHQLPQKIDYEPTAPTEAKINRATLVGGMVLSVSLFTYLAFIDRVPWITLAVGPAIDAVQLSLSYLPLRSWSNYFKRVSTSARYGFNFLYNMFWSTAFYMAMNIDFWPPIFEEVLPAAVFRTISATTISSALFLWEAQEANGLNRESRAKVRSLAFGALQIILGAAWFYSLSPIASPIYSGIPHFEMNWGHGVLGLATLAGAAAWLKESSFAQFTTKTLPRWRDKVKTSCRRAVSGLGGSFKRAFQ